MGSEMLVSTVTVLMGLLFVAAIAAFLLSKVRFPYTVGLVLIGVTLAFLGDRFPALGEGLDALELEPELIMFVFIPALIFESAVNTDVRLLSKNLVPTLILAAPGLLLSTALIGFLVATFTPIPLDSALILGCLISATDPVAVIALFKDVGAPKRLTILVEGESLFNDATAIVTFQIILAVVATGILDTQTVFGGVLNFFIVFFGGLIVGLGFGYIVSIAIRLIGDEPLIHLTLTLVAAYGSFIVAEHYLHTSGIMAVLGTGLVIGYYGSVLYSHRVKESLEVFWESIAFVANSLIFLILGVSAQVFLTNVNGNVQGLLVPVLVSIVIVLLVRTLLVYSIVPLVNRIPGQRTISRGYQTVMVWGGLRGAVAVALAISLPLTFPFRWQIIDIAFGVILFTLLVNGTTMRFLLQRLKLDRPSPLEEYVGSFVQTMSKREALNRLQSDEIQAMGDASKPIREQYQQEFAQAEARLYELREQLGNTPETQHDLVWLRTIGIMHGIYLERYEDNLLSLDGLRELEWDLRQVEIDLDSTAAGTRPRIHTPAILENDMLQLRYKRGIFFRRGTQGITQVYEEVTALAVGSKAVLDKRDEVQEFANAGDELVNEIYAHYELLNKKANKRLRELEERYTDACQTAQVRQMHKHARDGERDVIRELIVGGELPDMISDRVERAAEG